MNADQTPATAAGRARATYLSPQSSFDRLEDWCRMVRVIFGVPPYLVGSALVRADYRDVDIRAILSDAVFRAWFRGRPEAVRFLNRALSVWGQRETGLPIDFQVQQQTAANADFDGPRSPMGTRDWSIIPTSGVPSMSIEAESRALDRDALAEAREAFSALLGEVYIPHHTPSSEGGPEEWDVELDAPEIETCERALRALAILAREAPAASPEASHQP